MIMKRIAEARMYMRMYVYAYARFECMYLRMCVSVRMCVHVHVCMAVHVRVNVHPLRVLVLRHKEDISSHNYCGSLALCIGVAGRTHAVTRCVCPRASGLSRSCT